MDVAGQDEGQRPVVDRPLSVSGAFEESEEIAAARDLARTFLESLQAVHGLPVSQRAMGMVQLVVSELVTNARKYAPGPCLLTLEVADGAVEVTVWDSNTVLPAVLAPDAARVGQHGLEIVMAVCRSFEVHREPVGKRIKVAVVLADDPGGDAAGRKPLL
ncbi:ATP-binding protein [Streptomyces sp. WAC05374]|uniref:ATP-binding protein n=1 Tax=Streptomyces sp. WAC05374 TaxID=2487420 RepID=UPI000F870FE9|nr:ATP-binding protein [Streptomyces sp. WAC05374]RST15008.1 ATP-binding protein [Streptomyces sp. WAC05374]TDF54715.1 ATP-binding protein [Streptomyces sp. WAC05374]TDF56351.1 ATP-binding protein [Streptomyces sp. WAC05374]